MDFSSQRDPHGEAPCGGAQNVSKAGSRLRSESSFLFLWFVFNGCCPSVPFGTSRITWTIVSGISTASGTEAEEVRSAALQKIPSMAHALNVQSPDLQELLDYMQCRGQFVGVSSLACRSFDVWSSLFPKSSLSPLGRMFAALPCSQNSVERVFSAADWATDNRERLGFAKLACEVFLRFNLLRLNASPMLQG